MQPNTTYLRMAQLFAEQYDATSDTNKGEFLKVWDVVKGITKDDRVKEVKAMYKASGTIQLNSARREYKALLTMSMNYATLPDRHANLTNITFENLQRTLKLVARVTKYYEGDMDKLEPLSKLWLSGMSAYRYNNLVEAKCKELMEKYPAIVPTKAVTTEDALLYLDGVDVTVKTAMLERLLNDLGYSIAEVA